MAKHSLRGRLVGLVLLFVAAGWAAVSAITYQDARREIDAVLDGHLEQAAALLAVQADHELFELGGEGVDALRPYGAPVVFQVWDSNGRLRARSTNAPASRLSARDRGFEDAQSGTQRWRVYSQWDADHSVLVQIAETREGRERLARRFVLRALWPLAVALPLFGVLVWIAVSGALRPLAELRLEVSRRRASDLQPLTPRRIPAEVEPLIVHLNALFERIRGTLESERRFTSHAAHELRTPIAAIRAQAESALEAPLAAERQQALNQVIAACDRLSRMVTQLLTLARMDEEAAQASVAACRVDELAARVVADLAPAALERGVEIGLRSADATRIAADPVLVEVLLRNLLDNAVSYAGSGRHVEVAIEREPTVVRLSVTDDGVPLADADLAQLGRPFFRGSPTATAGTGLGLSIVGRIAERHGADLRYTRGEQGRGLRVEVTFPV